MRDLRTDAERGRIYLPQDELRRFGYSEEDLLRGRYTQAYLELMRFQADRTHAYYRAARAARPRVDRRRLVAAEIMGVIYHRLLRAIEARHFRVFERRIRLSAPRKLALALGVYLRAQLSP
jgi:phytoene synthase